MQDLSHHPGQVHFDSLGVHRVHHLGVLRLAEPGAREVDRPDAADHPDLQSDRHCRQLRRRLVRHPGQYLRQLARRVREPARQAVPDLRDSAARRHEHRHAAHQRGAPADAVHSAVHPARLRRSLLHRLRDRRVARRGRAAHRRRHLHENCRHRIRPDENRLQHQGRRCAQPGRDCGLHRGQRRRFGRPERRRVRDLRRHRRRADHVHRPCRARRGGAGGAARLDLRDAHHDDRRERAVVLHQRSGRQEPLRRRRQDEFRGAADLAGLADLDRVGRHHLRRVLHTHPRSRRRHAVVEAVDRDHVRHARGRDHSGARQDLHVGGIGPREGGRRRLSRGRCRR